MGLLRKTLAVTSAVVAPGTWRGDQPGFVKYRSDGEELARERNRLLAEQNEILRGRRLRSREGKRMGLTNREYAVLRAAQLSSDSYAMGSGSPYQPSESVTAVADDLLSRGLMAQRPGWPSCLVLTDAGQDALSDEMERRDG